MVINHNIKAMNAQRQMYKTSNAQSKATEKLSSGLRINRAGDDAAGLAISEKMRGQISGLNQASRNAQDAISLIQTAEGAMDEQHSMLQRMRELSVQAANGTNTDDDKAEIQAEIDQLAEEITAITTKTEQHSMLQRMRELSVQAANGTNTDDDKAEIQAEIDQLAEEITAITTKTEFNTKKLLNGDLDGGISFQVGANANQTIEVAIDNMAADELGVDSLDVTGAANDAISAIDAAINTVSSQRSKLGAVQNRLEHTIANVDNSAENLQAAESRIRDTAIDAAINTVSSQRSKLGAVQNRLEHTIANVDNSAENLQAAESRIRDTDMAKEMMNLTSKNVLAQATQSMLAQANQRPNQVLSLLQ